MIKQPMLSAKFDKDPAIAALQMKAIVFPVFVSYKIDGIRAHSDSSQLLSRKNKPIPNLHTQDEFGLMTLDKLDGELVEGKPNTPDCFNRTQSAVMSVEGAPDVKWYLFDSTRGNERSFTLRQSDLFVAQYHPKVIIVKQTVVNNLEELYAFEEQAVLDGWEGVMIRAIHGPYKQGRSTLREGWLIKMKRFEDSEAIILGCYEQETNNNEATINEVGRSKRSSHKENKVANGHLGGFHVRDLHSGVEFDVGTLEGVTKDQRYSWWQDKPESFVGKVIKYRFFPVGVKDKPRHPIFIGFRNLIDL